MPITKTRIIKRAPLALRLAAFHSGDFDEVDRLDDIAEKELKEVFESVAAGAVKVAYFNMPAVKNPRGGVSVMRYALHRSPKNDGYLQMSCMEIRGGVVIPTSDRQYRISDGVHDFYLDVPEKVVLNLCA